ncbi:MAG TPA: hypothetical protein VN442_02070 [Bryobacteraceae bacterium]|nr:hypothetical protein [Bryobacteraceae bacterium]
MQGQILADIAESREREIFDLAREVNNLVRSKASTQVVALTALEAARVVFLWERSPVPSLEVPQ